MIFRRWMLIYKNSEEQYFDCCAFTHAGIIKKYHDVLNYERPTSVFVYHYEGGNWAYSFGWCDDE